MILTTVFSTSFDKAKRLVVKLLRFGLNDTQTAIEISPYGVDSNPIKDMIALYDKTPGSGETVIVGYMNKNRLSAPGEFRAFSTDSSGNLKSYIWLKNNGNLELNGNADHAVRFQALETALNNMVNLISENLPLIEAGIVAGGGTYTPIPVTLDISAAKIDTVLTP
jgi:hypothetical protein